MPEFEYVSRREAQPIKKEVIALIHKVQDYVRKDFTFGYRFVGNSTGDRNMITREKDGNKGFDFNVDLIPNVDNDKYTAAEIATILFTAIDHCMRIAALNKQMEKYGEIVIDDLENVFTIKVIDRADSKTEHSCDFKIIRTLCKRKEQYKQCIYVDKILGVRRWEISLDYDIEKRLQLIKDHDLSSELRDRYLSNKNQNKIPTKKSREIFSETVNSILYEYHI